MPPAPAAEYPFVVELIPALLKTRIDKFPASTEFAAGFAKGNDSIISRVGFPEGNGPYPPTTYPLVVDETPAAKAFPVVNDRVLSRGVAEAKGNDLIFVLMKSIGCGTVVVGPPILPPTTYPVVDEGIPIAPLIGERSDVIGLG